MKHRSAAQQSLAGSLGAQAEKAADLLKAMANPQRLRVLCLLVEGERSVGQLNSEVELSQSALSQHLAKLREEGLVVTRKDAQTVFYSLTPGPALDIIRVLHAVYCPDSGHRSICS